MLPDASLLHQTNQTFHTADPTTQPAPTFKGENSLDERAENAALSIQKAWRGHRGRSEILRPVQISDYLSLRLFDYQGLATDVKQDHLIRLCRAINDLLLKNSSWNYWINLKSWDSRENVYLNQIRRGGRDEEPGDTKRPLLGINLWLAVSSYGKQVHLRFQPAKAEDKRFIGKGSYKTVYKQQAFEVDPKTGTCRFTPYVCGIYGKPNDGTIPSEKELSQLNNDRTLVVQGVGLQKRAFENGPFIACPPEILDSVTLSQIAYPSELLKANQAGSITVPIRDSEGAIQFDKTTGAMLQSKVYLKLVDFLGCLRDAAVGIHSMHTLPMLHLDLSPSNINLAYGCPPGESADRVYGLVADFDLASPPAFGNAEAATYAYWGPSMAQNSLTGRRGGVATPFCDRYAIAFTALTLLFGGNGSVLRALKYARDLSGYYQARRKNHSPHYIFEKAFHPRVYEREIEKLPALKEAWEMFCGVCLQSNEVYTKIENQVRNHSKQKRLIRYSRATPRRKEMAWDQANRAGAINIDLAMAEVQQARAACCLPDYNMTTIIGLLDLVIQLSQTDRLET
jgi:hypothetical protein